MITKFTLIGCLVSLIVSTSAHAALLITAEEVGPDVVVSASGSLDVSSLTLDDSGDGAGVAIPDSGLLFVGPGFVSFDQYAGITGPTAFGSGGLAFPSSGSGGLVGVNASTGVLRVPGGYVSNDPITASMTFNNKTLAGLGMAAATYVWTWGSGPSADSLTLQVVPEPASASLLALALAGLAVIRRRRRTG